MTQPRFPLAKFAPHIQNDVWKAWEQGAKDGEIGAKLWAEHCTKNPWTLGRNEREWNQRWKTTCQEAGIPQDRRHWAEHSGSTWTMQLQQPLRLKASGVRLSRVTQCWQCDELFLTSACAPNCLYCSTACREQSKAERDARRKQAKANRQGRCQVCGSLFRVQRNTARTCSQRCKKALQRHPERYQMVMPEPHTREELLEAFDAKWDPAPATLEEMEAHIRKRLPGYWLREQVRAA